MPIVVRKNYIALLLVLALSLPLVARADEATHRAKAEQMMTLLQTQRMVKQISDNITKQVTDAADSVAGPNPSPTAKAKVAEFEKQATQMIDGQLSWGSMKAGFVDVYIKNFTEEQLDAIIAFYKTPAGLALLANMPTVNTQVTQFGTSRMSTLQPQLKQLFEDFRKDVTAPPMLGPVPAPAAPSPSSTPK